MGYRSDVAFVISFDTHENAKEYYTEVCSKFADVKAFGLGIAGCLVYFHNDYIKWYEDFEEIQQLTKVYEESIETKGFEGYVFKRLGEDRQDYDCYEEGNNPPWDAIEENRSLILNI